MNIVLYNYTSCEDTEDCSSRNIYCINTSYYIDFESNSEREYFLEKSLRIDTKNILTDLNFCFDYQFSFF